MTSIIFIIPYFGRFNNYFRYWWESAKNNPTVDFLICTDQEVEEVPNIKVKRTTFQELSTKFMTKLNELTSELGMSKIGG